MIQVGRATSSLMALPYPRFQQLPRKALVCPSSYQRSAQTRASTEEIMEVLKLCVAAGAEACRITVPILPEELKDFEGR